MKARPPVCLNREKTQTMLMDFPYTCIFGIFYYGLNYRLYSNKGTV